ncbi:MAG: sodium-translocating pyrophosphatase [Elusimicrobiota bacterium]
MEPTTLLPWAGVLGIGGFGVAVYNYFHLRSMDTGDAATQEIADTIQAGAFVFLRREYKIIAIFVALVFAALWAFVGRNTAFAYFTGASFSMFAGWFGMQAATTASSRTLEAAKQGGAPLALEAAFRGGSVMGITVAALGLVGVTLVFYFSPLPEVINGFAMGASSIALFARIGGGIYTKAADVGADIVGKTEANIPEDDPRNPGVIADNVGDNVGDTAGMGADLFESYVGSIVACIALAFTWDDPTLRSNGMLLPLYLATIGLVASVIGVWSMKLLRSMEPDKALHMSTYVAAFIFAVGSYIVITKEFGSANYFFCVVAGLMTGVAIGMETDWYTSKSPIIKQAETSQSGPATAIINGIAVGFESVIAPMVTLVIGIYVAHRFGDAAGSGLYGIALAALGMLSTIGIIMATDSYGPIADNAGGLAEMSGAGEDIRKITDRLDAIGNTTAAVGKGFAIGSAALTALALFTAFQKTAESLTGKPLTIELTNVKVVMGLFLGVTMPCLIAALTMKAVGRAANRMVLEIRRQFKEIKGLLEGTAKPDSNRCIDIVTAAALQEMIVPGVSAIVAPLLVGKILGLEALGGFLAGATACGVAIGLMMANAGAVWDNAKKHIEQGNFGGKGSDTHKAAVVGDTVGDPFKDTSGPAMNILIKLMTIVSLVFLPALI